MIFVTVSKTMKVLGYMALIVYGSYTVQLYKYHSIYMDYLKGTKTFDCQTYTEAE